MSLRFVSVAACALLAACYALEPEVEFPDSESAESGVSAEALFDYAARSHGVPAPLLQAVAWHQTSFSSGHDDHAAHAPSHGWMGLTDERMQEAAALTGLSADAIAHERDAGVLAGAALLSELRDGVAPDAPADHVSAEWWEVVAAWPQLEEPWMGYDYARDVFRTLQMGADAITEEGETLTIRPRRIPGLADVAYVPPPTGTVERSTVGWPGRTRFYGAHSGNQSSRSGGTSAVQRVVLHTTEGSYNGAISWFRNNSSNVSAHYVIRKSDGEVTQMVGDDRKAWHACRNNNDTIGIEHEGAAASASTWTPAMLDSSARLTAWLVQQYNIPIDRNHIVGHGEIQPSSCSGRTDPGSHFPWTQYMGMVQSYVNGNGSGSGNGGGGGTNDGYGPLAFDAPADGAEVTSPVAVEVTHPDSHIELWSGPALLASHIFDHPATFDASLGSGLRNLTARAYRASGSHLATRSITVDVTDGTTVEPGDTSLHSTNEQHVGGSTIRFTAAAGDGVARVEYWIDGWRLPDALTGRRWGLPTDFSLTYTFNFTGPRALEIRAYDGSDTLTDTIAKTIEVPSVDDDVDHVVTSFPYNHSSSTSNSARAELDGYSCAPSINESGPEVVYAVDVPEGGYLVAEVTDGAGVDVDLHILSALEASACRDRGHVEAGATVTAGTWYVVVDSWVGASGQVYAGAYDLTIRFVP